MNSNTGAYIAIITADVLQDKRLSSSEKIFYAEITRLSNKKGYCWASNKHFSESLNVKRSTVSAWVNKLERCKYIKVKHIRDGKQIIERHIYPVINSNVATDFDYGGVVRKSEGGGQKIGIGWSENPKDISKHDKQTLNTEYILHHFDEFWDLYDKKVERKKCERKWKKLSKDDIESILQFVPIYKESVSSKQYQKNPFTFLNSRIWEDDWENYKPKANEAHQQFSEKQPSRTSTFSQRGQQLLDALREREQHPERYNTWQIEGRRTDPYSTG